MAYTDAMRRSLGLALVACLALLPACATPKPQPLGEVASRETQETVSLTFVERDGAYRVDAQAQWHCGGPEPALYPDSFKVELMTREGKPLRLLGAGTGVGVISMHSKCWSGIYDFARSVPRDEVAEAVVTLGTIEKRFAVPQRDPR